MKYYIQAFLIVVTLLSIIFGLLFVADSYPMTAGCILLFMFITIAKGSLAETLKEIKK